MNMPIRTHELQGINRISGAISGNINGHVVGRVSAIVRGEVNAFVDSGSITKLTEEVAERELRAMLLPVSDGNEDEASGDPEEESDPEDRAVVYLSSPSSKQGMDGKGPAEAGDVPGPSGQSGKEAQDDET
jgi:hypothetical protein